MTSGNHQPSRSCGIGPPSCRCNRSFPEGRSLTPRQRLQELNLPTRRNGSNDFPRNSAAGGRPIAARDDRTRHFALIEPPKAARQAHCGRLATTSGPLVGSGRPQPEAQARHKRVTRPKVWANNCRGTATSASRK